MGVFEVFGFHAQVRVRFALHSFSPLPRMEEFSIEKMKV